MEIVIAGAGDMGFHLAQMLAYEDQDIVLIDTDQDVLDYAATHLDVLTIRGDSSSIDVLRKAEIEKTDLFLAVTTSEKNNLVSAILAKKMGVKQSIARVSNTEYLDEHQKASFKELGIDNLISPRQLAALEIGRLLRQCSFTDIFEFEKGKLNLVGITLDGFSPLVGHKISDIRGIETDVTLSPIAVLRGQRTIVPRSDTLLYKNDHIYFITRKQNVERIEQIVGKKKVKVKRIMIIGGTDLGLATAQELEHEYNVTLVAKNKDRCKEIAENLSSALVIHGDTSDIDLLVEEGLDNMDAFIALTPNAETNIIASLTAKRHGVYKTIAQVENKEYTYISQDIGVDTLINKKLIAANNIFRYVRKGRIEAITTLHGVDAEVIEYVVHKNNRLTKKSLKDLHFPKKALIGGVVRGEETIIPKGDFKLQVDDKVIVFALPEAIGKIEKLFR